jgi:ubiquinone/menaquinone biosynthesis C-methylase UbiE
MKKALILCLSTLLLTLISPVFGQSFDYSAQANALESGSGTDAGLCIHVGSGNGKLTAELARNGKWLVHGFDSNPTSISGARTWIKSQNLYGQASVEQHNFTTLPYASNLANVIVIDDFARLSPEVSLSEVFRVLCPNGVAWVGQSAAISGSVTVDQIKSKLSAAGISDSGTLTQYGTWVKVVKSRSSQMDDWTHLRYGSDGNVVSKDLQGIPAGLQWLTGPSWSLGNAKANGLGTVTSAGRVFFFVNGGTTYGSVDPSRRLSIVARDAYNGMLLWERVWTTTSTKFVDDLAPLVPLIATPDVLYTWADNQICALDTKTGNKLRVFASTAVNPPLEMVLDQNRLFFTPSAPSPMALFAHKCTHRNTIMEYFR